MYGSAVTFYEPIKLSHRSVPRMWEDLGTDDKVVAPLTRATLTLYTLKQVQLHMSKCICVLSRWPFFSAFKVFLSSLYRISLSPGTALPIERYDIQFIHCIILFLHRYISNLMSDVPFPSESRPRVMMEVS